MAFFDVGGEVGVFATAHGAEEIGKVVLRFTFEGADESAFGIKEAGVGDDALAASSRIRASLASSCFGASTAYWA
jgi:hypothetical protein